MVMRVRGMQTMKPVAGLAGLVLCLLGLLSPALAGEREVAKCAVRQADGTLRIRWIEIDEVREAQRALQRFLDQEAPGEGRQVERCIGAREIFSSAQARAAERSTPR